VGSFSTGALFVRFFLLAQSFPFSLRVSYPFPLLTLFSLPTLGLSCHLPGHLGLKDLYFSGPVSPIQFVFFSFPFFVVFFPTCSGDSSPVSRRGLQPMADHGRLPPGFFFYAKETSGRFDLIFYA